MSQSDTEPADNEAAANEPAAEELTKLQSVGMWFGIFAVIIPCMITSGFMPDLNVLPFETWVTIAAAGAGVGGMLVTGRPVAGGLSGAVTGAGALFGGYFYVIFRSMIVDSNTFWNLELTLANIVGAIPGVVLYYLFGGFQEDGDLAEGKLAEEDEA